MTSTAIWRLCQCPTEGCMEDRKHLEAEQISKIGVSYEPIALGLGVTTKLPDLQHGSIPAGQSLIVQLPLIRRLQSPKTHQLGRNI